VFVQAGRVRSRGFEADLTASPSASWRINAAYGFTDAEFLDYQQTLTVNLAGNRPGFAPRHTFNLWTAYEWPNGLGVNVGTRYFGSVFAQDANELELDAYGLLNLGVRYRRGRLEYALNVNNVTDTEYFSSVLYDTQVYPGDPVNVLGTVRVRMP
jgi:iron complex outermembrane receptor protein